MQTFLADKCEVVMCQSEAVTNYWLQDQQVPEQHQPMETTLTQQLPLTASTLVGR